METETSQSRASLSGDMERINSLLKKKDTVIGILAVLIVAGFAAYALLEYSKITQVQIQSLVTSEDHIVRNVVGDEKPRAFAVVDGVTSLAEDEVLFSSEEMGISFSYRDTYSQTRESSGGQIVLREDDTGNILALVYHPVEDSVSLTEFVDQHVKTSLEGCYDVVDCVISEVSQSATVSNYPTLIQSSNESTVFIRGGNAVFEILTTGGEVELERLLNSIRFTAE